MEQDRIIKQVSDATFAMEGDRLVVENSDGLWTMDGKEIDVEDITWEAMKGDSSPEIMIIYKWSEEREYLYGRIEKLEEENAALRASNEATTT